MKRVAITGSSGYLGRKFAEHLRRQQGQVEILGIDVRAPGRTAPPPDRFVTLDILSPDLARTLQDFKPDTVVHAAFVFAPIRDRRQMRRINVDGCRNLLAAVAGTSVERLMLVSSATVYGASAENPVPIDEGQPVRSSAFQYAADKVEAEILAGTFAERNPAVAVSRVRPAIIGGAGMDNYLYRFIFGPMRVGLLDGYDTPVQFVHEDDVVAAMLAILTAGARGPFNIGPPDWCLASNIAAATRRSTVRLPFRLMKVLHRLAWAAHLPGHEAPAELLDFARYPWVVAPRRLEQELGFRFRYSSHATLQETIRSRQPTGKVRLTAAR
jgi:UDP-glucose 4-epimerase